jgi:hypothetical protein
MAKKTKAKATAKPKQPKRHFNLRDRTGTRLDTIHCSQGEASKLCGTYDRATPHNAPHRATEDVG